MGVVSCNLANGDWSSMPIPGLETEFDVPYIIVTDDVADNAATIYATGCLPAKWTRYADNIFATCRTVSCHRESKTAASGLQVWRAVVHYSSQPLTQKDEQAVLFSNPCDRAAEIEWDGAAYEMPVVCDIDGKAIINSAGDQPDQVASKTGYFLTANVVKNVTVVPAWVADYAGKVNAAEFTVGALVVPAECARIAMPKVSAVQKEGDISFVRLTMQIEIRTRRTTIETTWPPPALPGLDAGMPITYLFAEYAPPPFYLELCDTGLYYRFKHLIGGAVDHLPIYTDKTDSIPARPVSHAVPLDGLGLKLQNPTMENLRFMAYKLYETRNFTVLPLA